MKLTDEQIEQSAKAGYEALGEICWKWDSVSNESVKNDWRSAMRAAAPFLQAPWELPTEEEVETVASDGNYSSGSVFILLGTFITLRNAALLPKPVDPRREKLIAAIKTCTTPEALADAILAYFEEGRL